MFEDSEFYIYSNENYDNLPLFKSNDKYHIYFRGLFDRHGKIFLKNIIKDDLSCEIEKKYLSKDIIKKLEILYSFKEIDSFLKIENADVFDFLFFIYNDSDARFRNDEKYKKYIDIFTEINKKNIPTCKFEKVIQQAITPKKKRPSDVGHIIFLIKEIKNYSKTIFVYDTGLKIKPELGFYISFLPTSELTKSGYMLKDCCWTGKKDESVKIYLVKVDNMKQKLKFPFPCCKIVLNKFYNYII